MTPPAQALHAERDTSLVAHVLRLGKKKFYRVSEAAEELEVGRTQIYLLCESGELEMHTMTYTRGAQGGLFGESYDKKGRMALAERRSGIRITRRSLILYIARSAHYELSAEEHTAVIGQVLRDLPSKALEAIRAECSRNLAIRGAHAGT